MISDLISEISDLRSYSTQWSELATDAVEPNPFYEPWYLIPAMQHLESDNVTVLFIWSDESRQLLLAVFPLQAKNRYRGLPIKRTVLWKHDYCYLCTPLIRNGYIQAVLKAALDKMDSHSRLSSFALFAWLPANGPVAKCLQSEEIPGRRNSGEKHRFQRAFLPLNGSYETDFLPSMRTKKRKELNRTRRRFEELGNVETILTDRTSSVADVTLAVDEFLHLENSGWKSKGGTALQCNPEHARFFETMLSEGMKRGQAFMVQIRLNGKMVSAVTSIIAGGGDLAYAVKMASMEQYQQHSLGSQVILELTRHAYTLEGVSGFDSCAAENHPMINRLWRERTEMINLNSTRKNNLLNLVIPMTDLVIALAKKLSPQK